MDHYRKRCIDLTNNGRCPQQTRNEFNDNRCYYHSKVNRGLMSTAEVIDLLDDDEVDKYDEYKGED